VILVDANLLICAYIPSVPPHTAAAEWLEARMNEPGRVGLPWASLFAFLRLVSNPKIFEEAVSIPEAWDRVREWLALEVVWTPLPTNRHAEILGDLLERYCTESDLVSDAHLAALAIEHGLTLCTTDGDFARFPGLKWENPLA